MPPRVYITFDPKAYQKDYYQTHKEEYKRRSHERYLVNKTTMNKQSKLYRESHLEQETERQRGYRRKQRAWFDWVMGFAFCMDCGLSDKRVLDWHHRDPSKKRFDVAGYHSIQATIEEMEKCDIVCANCHRIRHHEPIRF